jgi:hypothetical protein
MPLEASMRVINGIPLGCSLLLPFDAVNSVQPPKAAAAVEAITAAAAAKAAVNAL